MGGVRVKPRSRPGRAASRLPDRATLVILGLPIRRARSSKWYFSLVDEAQRLRGLVLESLDREQDARGLARDAHRSRTQFYRLFQAMIEETPVAMRRRLLLERAAWQLSRTELSVTEIGLNANYGSLEAFTRAFRKAFRVSPSLYRRIGATYTHLHATNGIHHHFVKDRKGASQSMDLYDIFSGQESWHTRRLLEQANTLNDEQLDRPLKNEVKVFPWDGPDQSLRQILERMVQTKEVWAAAITGGSMPALDNTPPAERTPAALLARLERADAGFHRRAYRSAQSKRLGGYVCGCAVRAAGDLHLRRNVRSRDHVQRAPADACNGGPARHGGESRRLWLSQRVRREFGQDLKGDTSGGAKR